MIKQGFQPAPSVKIMLNIGACLDIPTGFYVKGKHGESILLGGLGALTGITGRGNMFKSTIMHYMMLSAADRLMATAETSMSTYDTEINIHEERLRQLTDQFTSFTGKDIITDGTWVITDRTVYHGNDWYEKLKSYLKENKKQGDSSIMYETPFMERDGKTLMKTIIPTFSEVDSFSRFETEDVARMQDENALGESGGNTIHMRQGLAKMRFLMEVPGLAGTHNHFMLLSAHLGQDTAIASGPYAAPPPKKLQHMKMGEKIKGVTDQFFFLTNNFWMANSVTPLVNQGTKGPEYPKSSDNNAAGDLDLNLVSLKQLRSKSGPSGNTIEIIVSQTEGVLPGLTEFNYIKDSGRFGLNGSLQNYALDIYPECKLSRTTVRGKLDKDLKLRRAMNITSELCQIQEYFKAQSEYFCAPAELYKDLKELGYDWDMILSQTRGWWTVNNETHPLKFLSTMDLLRMRKGEYKPYWLT
jgi:hypothetical protein